MLAMNQIPFYPFFALLVGCGIGLAIFVYGLSRYLKYHQAKYHWLSAKAKVIHIAIGFYNSYEDELLDHIYPIITYQYTYNHQQYRCTQVAFSMQDIIVMRPKFNDLIGRYEPLRIWWNDLQLDEDINIKLNPNNPEQAIIFHGDFHNDLHRRWRYLMIALLGLLVIVGFFILFI